MSLLLKPITMSTQSPSLNKQSLNELYNQLISINSGAVKIRALPRALAFAWTARLRR